jgi:transcriptional regulator with XRE-family HTH domain
LPVTGNQKMLCDRLKKIIQDSGLPLDRFARKTGVSKNTLINYRDGTTSPAAVFLESVCREFSADPGWLLLGEGSDGGCIGEPGPDVGANEGYVLIPLLESRVAAGPEGEILYGETADYYPFKEWWVEKLVGKSRERQRSLFLIRVRGDSMSPTINQGEIALVDTWEEERLEVLPGRIYLVVLPDGAAVLKRLVLSGDERGMKLVCLSDNTPDYRPFEFALGPGKSIKSCVLGRVRWAGKEFD